jgi:hypothetical protein
MRFLSSAMRQIGKGAEHLYDAVIFLPLLIERAVMAYYASRSDSTSDKSSRVGSFPKRATGGML